MIVVDANILVHHFLNGEHRSLLERVWEKDPEWVTSALWRSEFRNVCLKMHRFGKIPLPVLQKGLEEAEESMRAFTFRVQTAHVMAAALRYHLSAYDAEYVSLGIELDCQVLSIDKAMRNNCPDWVAHPYEWLESR